MLDVRIYPRTLQFSLNRSIGFTKYLHPPPIHTVAIAIAIVYIYQFNEPRIAVLNEYISLSSAGQHRFRPTSGRTGQGIANQLLLKWMVMCNMALTVVKKDEFRSFLAYLNQSFHPPRSPNTFRRWSMDNFERKVRLAKILQDKMSHSHSSIDGWSNPNYTMSVIGVLAHFTTRDRDMCDDVIARG